MIAAPLNDRACLDQVTAIAVESLGHPEALRLARQCPTTEVLAAYIRTLPQRNDDGDPSDGPKIACDVVQRVRVGPPDPNCVERALVYVATAELIDPRPVRQLATLSTAIGPHTIAVERGEPVHLDPRLTRNALGAGLWTQVWAPDVGRWPRNGGALDIEGQRTLKWITKVAEETAEKEGGTKGKERVIKARATLGALVRGAPVAELRRSAAGHADLGYTLDAASAVAPMWGPPGVIAVGVARAALGFLGLLPRENPKGSQR